MVVSSAKCEVRSAECSVLSAQCRVPGGGWRVGLRLASFDGCAKALDEAGDFCDLHGELVEGRFVEVACVERGVAVGLEFAAGGFRDDQVAMEFAQSVAL